MSLYYPYRYPSRLYRYNPYVDYVDVELSLRRSRLAADLAASRAAT